MTVVVASVGAFGCSGSNASHGPTSAASATDTASGTASGTATATASPSGNASATPDEVAGMVQTAFEEPATATVRIQIGTQCTFDGTARFGSSPTLVGRVDFRDSEADSDYVARDGRVRVTVPAGEEFPGSTATQPHNPWGPALSRVDPGIVPLVIEEHGTTALELPGPDGGTSFIVTLDGPGTLTDFGSDPSSDLPQTVSYKIELDADGRLAKVNADFGGFGNDFVTFTRWKMAGSVA